MKYVAYCISLKNNENERDLCKQEFVRIGIDVEFHIVEPHPVSGRLGCYESHQDVLSKGLSTEAEFIVVFEDDVYFEELDQDKFLNLLSWVGKCPSDQRWCLELGYFTHMKSHLVTKDILALDYCACAHAYVVPRCTAQRLKDMVWCETPFDIQWSEVIDQFYAPYPMVAFQRDHFSIVSQLSSLFMKIIGFRNIARLSEWWSRRFF